MAGKFVEQALTHSEQPDRCADWLFMTSRKQTVMKKWLVWLGLILAVQARAYDGLSSELSHAAGGALMAGVVTQMYGTSEHRAWIGFAVSSAAVVVEQGYEISRGARRSSQVLDMAAHTLGAALGAWYSDKYLLMPVVSSRSVGVLVVHGF